MKRALRAPSPHERSEAGGARGRVPRGWYRSSFGDEYLRIYRRRDREEARREAEMAARALDLCPGDEVLDLCCGAGRHIDPLVEQGLRMIGLDYSLPLLQRARDRLAGRAWLVQADMRSIPLAAASQRGVCSFFTSFGYFFEEHENQRVLAEVARVLTGGGGYLIDLMDRETVLAGLVPESRRCEGDWILEERRWISPDGARVEKEVKVKDARSGSERRFQESVRLYGPAEASDALDRAGIPPVHAYGGFDGSPHSPGESARMILVGRKPS